MSDEGFLSRWSRRKRADEQLVHAEDTRIEAERAPAVPAGTDPIANLDAEQAALALPDLPPVDSLTPQADFTPFMQSRVPVALKNAALKKLFADPHFNVMDGLDTYIEDYANLEPMPPQMLRELVQARALKLFEEDERQEKAAEVGPAAIQSPASADTGEATQAMAAPGQHPLAPTQDTQPDSSP